MSDNSSKASDGIGFCGLLTITFIALKLTDNIDWSWWWVLSPLWLPIVFAVVVMILIAVAPQTKVASAWRYLADRFAKNDNQ